MRYESSKKVKILFYLLVCLLLFKVVMTFFATKYVVVNGGDAFTYWGQNSAFESKSWLANFGLSTSFIIFLNYPLIILGFPIELGFVIYSLVGLLGFYFFIKWIWELDKIIEFSLFGWLCIATALFSPNLHFWTSILGKEPLMFLCLSLLAWASLNIANRKWIAFFALTLLFLVRPHVFLMLGLAGLMTALLYNPKKLLNFYILLPGLLLMILAGYITLQLTKIKTLNWERIQRFNDFSVTSFKNSNAFVPMNEMSYPEKVFAFLFRPLFENNSFKYIIASIENLVILCIMIITLYFFLTKKITYSVPKKLIFMIFFTLICTLFYIERYANWGIFMRTKIQFLPFLLVGIASWVSKIYFKWSFNKNLKI